MIYLDGQFFRAGEHYSRKADIHDRFGGQQRGGISTPSLHPYVFVFTGAAGEHYGYEDGWREDGVFLFTGEGQVGDMRFHKGNAAIRDHDLNGKELLLFEALGKSKPVLFIGRFACQSWDVFTGPDRTGSMRECIQFHLVKLSGYDGLQEKDELPPPSDGIEVLRKRAYDAAVPKQARSWKSAQMAYRARSEAVRSYVLARANGRCELTGRAAPFQTRSGEPYLEVHHTRRIADDGPDDPRFVAAICPSIHREIHFGMDGEDLNSELVSKLKQIEG